MRLRYWLLFLPLLLCLTALGCRADTEDRPSPSDTTEETTVHVSDDTTSSVTASAAETEVHLPSPWMVEEYLLPPEDFSWEREVPPEYVMLHFTSNVVASRENPYELNAVRQIFINNGVSIHYLIDRDGTVYCYIPEERVAWHAGKGSYGGDDRLTNNMNHYAIGIEIMAIGSQADMAKYLTAEEYLALDPTLIGYTEAQYAALSLLLPEICDRYDIPFDREHIIGHQDYRPSKNDPGELFDWERVLTVRETP